MSDDIKKMRTLMLRLESAINRIEDVADSFPGSSASSTAPAATIESNTSKASESEKEVEQEPDAPAVVEFDAFAKEHLDKFISLAKEIGDVVAEQAESLKSAFSAERTMIVTASKSKKPDQSSAEYLDFFKPLQDALAEVSSIKDKNRPSPLFNHLSTVAEGIGALGWVAVEPTPGPYVGDMKDSAQFYANRVIKDNKESKPKHVEWARSYISLLAELQKYVKSNHTTGITWNSKGVDLKISLSSAAAPSAPAPSAGGPPPPPPPGPPPPPFMGDATTSTAPASDMNSVFAALNQGSSVTAGLKKVDKSQMTHKNPSLRNSSVVPDKKPAPSAKPPALSRQQSKMKKPSRKELEGTKWIIENYENDSNIVINELELNHTVYVYNCKNCTIQLKGKFNALSLDSCAKTGVVVDTLVSAIDLVKSTSFALQVLDKCPTVICDVCDSGQIYLSKTGLDCEIVTSKCGSINVNIPDPESGEFKEEAVPEMLKHQVVNGKLETSIVVHAD